MASNTSATSGEGNLLVKIVFPPTFSIASKTFDFSSSQSVNKAVVHVKEQVKNQLAQKNADWGFYLPEKKIWLDGETQLKEYSNLLETAVRQY
jgi:hypothetical protein